MDSLMMLAEVAECLRLRKDTVYRCRFSGQQTFPFRCGGPAKGVRGVGAYPGIFSRDDAPVLLGVGKKTVASIRQCGEHWTRVWRAVDAGSVSPHR